MGLGGKPLLCGYLASLGSWCTNYGWVPEIWALLWFSVVFFFVLPVYVFCLHEPTVLAREFTRGATRTCNTNVRVAPGSVDVRLSPRLLNYYSSSCTSW